MHKQLESYLIVQRYNLLSSDKSSSLYKQGDMNLLITKEDKEVLFEFFVSLTDHIISSQKIKYVSLPAFKEHEDNFKKLTEAYPEVLIYRNNKITL